MVSRITGMLRDIVLAFSFGTHEALAALFVAFRLTLVTRRLFGEGALQSAFIPVFEEVRKESYERGSRFFRDLSLLWIGLLSFITILGMIGLWGCLTYGEFEEGTKEIMMLMIMMMPSLIPTCLFGLNISFLQCEKHFFSAGIAPSYFNLVVIIAALILRGKDTASVMPWITFAIVLGCTAQWFASFVPALKLCRDGLKGKILSQIHLFSSDVKRLWLPLALGIVGVGASQINNAIDAIFARVADPEGPAQLWFAIRFQQLPLALFGIALSSAILPPLSRAIQANDREKYAKFLEFGIRQVIAFLLPCTGVLLVIGMAIINCIFGHGGFQSHSVATTTSCLHGYALALVPMGLIIVLGPAFYAQKNYRIPIQGACLSLVSNLVLNSFLVFGLGWKAMSVSIATSISSWLNAAYLYWELKNSFGPLMSNDGVKSCGKSLCATLITSATVWTGIALWTFPPVFFGAWMDSSSLIPKDIISQTWHLSLPLAAFSIGFLGCAWMLGANDVFVFFRRKEIKEKLIETKVTEEI
jgi:putative peptidoglycan lipid II flippase